MSVNFEYKKGREEVKMMNGYFGGTTYDSHRLLSDKEGRPDQRILALHFIGIIPKFIRKIGGPG